MNLNGINTVEPIPPEDGLEQLKKRFGERQDLLNEEYEKILPFSFIITLTDLNLSNQIQKDILELDNVNRINSADETISMLVKIANAIRIMTGAILVILVFISIFIIANTIKLTVHSRRKEISIMKYVGATNGFIRWPFIVEGIIIGFLASAISIGLVAGGYNLIATKIIESGTLDKLGMSLVTFGDMFNLIIIVYLLLGAGIGVVGSSISMRKYLKV